MLPTFIELRAYCGGLLRKGSESDWVSRCGCYGAPAQTGAAVSGMAFGRAWPVCWACCCATPPSLRPALPAQVPAALLSRPLTISDERLHR